MNSMLLPQLQLQDAKTAVAYCRNRLEKLGEPRPTRLDQQLHLLRVGQKYSALTKAVVKDYVTRNELARSFFSKETPNADDYCKRSCIVIQHNLLEFADEIQSAVGVSQDKTPFETGKATRIVGEMFSTTAMRSSVDTAVKHMLESASTTVSLIVDHIVDAETKALLLRMIVNPALNTIGEDLKKNVSAGISEYKRDRSRSFDNCLTQKIREAEDARYDDAVSKKLHTYFDVGQQESSTRVNRSLCIAELVKILSRETVEEPSAPPAFDKQTYYEVRSPARQEMGYTVPMRPFLCSKYYSVNLSFF